MVYYYMSGYSGSCFGSGWNFQFTTSCFAKNFLYWQVPMYLLMFSIIFIVLAKLLNSAITALPIAVVVTAATASYFLLFTRNVLFFGFSDLVVLLGVAIAYAVVARMFFRV